MGGGSEEGEGMLVTRRQFYKYIEHLKSENIPRSILSIAQERALKRIKERRSKDVADCVLDFYDIVSWCEDRIMGELNK